MSIHIALHHKTHYKYDRLVNLGPQVVRLRPAPHSRTRILSYSLRVAPEKHFINWVQDPQSNYAARLVFPEKTRELCVEVDLVAEMAVFNPFDFFLEPEAENYPFSYDPALDHELAPFLQECQLTPNFKKYLAGVRREPRGEGKARMIDFLVGINQRLWKDIRYTIRLEPGVQTPEETLTKLSGSCRDSAWLLCQLLRHCGLATRFVSGYLIQLKADVKSLDGPSGAEKDFTDLHAWTEVYLPGGGWIGLDPTSGLLAGEGHVPLACTPDSSSAAPISGAVDECKCEFRHEMNVTRIYESPRVTLPYTENQWGKIESLGQAIDSELKEGDVRLTMGGEPTFVSIDDPDGAEWNFTAVSPAKRVLSDKLLKRLRGKFAPGALVHYGQGKWYPGETLPRWAFGCFWRRDGLPIWTHADLIADEAKDYKHTAEHCGKFIAALSARLGVDSQWIMPGYEDPFHDQWQERRLPANTDPQKVAPTDDEMRKRLAKIREQGLDSIVGHVLPIQRSGEKNLPGWISGPWYLRAERLYLAPGDSPMGLRLPLDSLPWVKESEYPYIVELDPAAPRPPLPPPEAFHQRYRQTASARPGKKTAAHKTDPTLEPKPGESAPWIVRTALCVEPRAGRLYVFMPPVAKLEDYLELVAAIEDTAAELKTPVAIEGYPPPRDPRLNVLKVTPDPGVIEVNLHPSASWDELVEHTTTLYQEARETRLGTEKFMLDGRHTSTGGGNHIIIGGATPADSPVLRRPDLLRSLLAYWQNHPSLSWVFSGLFVGPTSQAPRVDEARNDSLYELGVAFKELDRQLSSRRREEADSSASANPPPHVGGYTVPWLVDRVFRNLLIDASGSTHRAEFSIDKLYSPDSSTGRLGLVEMRAFEMPPDARMSLAQHLLLRGLVAKFWRQPYTNDLVRWGTDLHDRWLLPHFCETDFREVIDDLRAAGYPFEFEWFAPHIEFRFPRIGDLALRDLQIELRTALEPWHVLGEEGAAGGAVRYVDSSLERLQVKAQGLAGDRFAITCNGHRVPLRPTGTNGEGVAGVRYRAWQPPGCLQPTIGVHAPLRFDLYDRWNQRSLGGCTYHVTHPGGRSYETFPVNSYEAESRRLARFFRHGHQQGKFTPPPITLNRDFPFTLDLRNV